MSCGCSCGCRPRCGSCCGSWSKLPGANDAAFTLADATLSLDKRYDARYLLLTGGALTGPLKLDGGVPTTPDDATTKSYVDGKLTSLLTLLPSVATQADLPATTDPKGSVRTVLADGSMWLFDGTSWQTIGKASTPIPRGTATGDTLWWDGAAWQARGRELPAGTTVNEVLTWDGGKWVPQAPAKGVPDGVNDMDLLTWDASSGTWVTAADEFGDETNVTVATDGSSDGGVPVYDDGNNTWDVHPLGVDDLKEVKAGNPAQGDALLYDVNRGWEVASLPTPAATLDDLTDVVVTPPTTAGNVLTVDAAGQWTPRSIPAHNLDALTDVTVTPPTTAGNVLTVDGAGNWTPQPPAVTKADITALLQGIIHGAAVQAITATPPANPVKDEVYIVAGGGTGAFATHDNALAVWDGTQWTFTAPQANEAHLNEADNATYHWSGTAWVKVAAAAQTLASLTDTDTTTHPPAGGNALVWNATTGKWEPGTVSTAFPVQVLTRAAYAALTPKRADTVYVVTTQ